MKHYKYKLLLRLLLVIALATMDGFLIASQHYVFASFVFLFLIWSSVILYRFLNRTNKDTRRLINAIRFSESNISFKNFTEKGLPPELASEMEKSISKFNKKLFQIETEYQFYNSLLNRIDAGILVINKNEEIEWINKSALDEFGKTQLSRISDLQSASPELPHILLNIFPKETKIVKVQRGTQIRQLAITAVLFTTKGKELKLISIKNIESVLEESESDAWKKLIRVLTHEMMNSITPIISLSESFSEIDSIQEKDYNLIKKGMETIHRRSKGLVEFVRNYQQLTRIPPPTITPVSIQDMMNDLYNLLVAQGIRFNCEISPKNIECKGDRAQLEQVLLNLIKNAWEACSTHSDSDIQVKIFLNEYQRTVIQVIDNGCGILPEVQERIFMPFFTTKQGGSGIGLSICRQIIRAHGGHIGIESQLGQGTCFTVRL